MDPLKSLEDPRWSVDHLENRWSPLSGSIGLCLPYVSPSLHDQECLGDICTSSASIFEHLQWGAAPKEVTRCPRLLDCPDKPHRRGHQECYRRQAVMAYSSGGCMSGSWCPCGQDGFLFSRFWTASFCCVLTWQRELSGISFIKTRISVLRAPPSWSITSQRPSNALPQKVSF